MYRTLLEGVWLSEIRNYIPNEYLHSSKIFAEPHVASNVRYIAFHTQLTLWKVRQNQKTTQLYIPKYDIPVFISEILIEPRPRYARSPPAVRSFPARGTLVPRPRYTDNLRHRNGFFPFQFRLDPYSFRCAAFSFRRGTFPFRIGT